MKIYNTLTKTKEELKTIEPGKVRMYVCGPTVYNYIHIGNARPMIVFDAFRRFLEYKGYEVYYVSNFTDVDDKIIKRAIEENKTPEEVAEFYIKACREDMKGLNIKEATFSPRATMEMDGIIEMIQTLIDKGYAYVVSDGTVYYETDKFSDYGKLSHKNIEELQAGHRDIKVTGEEKKKSTDFVLWKPKKDGEPYWDSPWCKGRPGWHIECSCMAKAYLGDGIDIHAGGEDLIFPHHENEIAQSEAANGVTFSKYWMHNGFLNINNHKMSKSAGNFFTVREIAEKYDLKVLRFFMLSAHYRSPLNFSDDLMEAAKRGLERIVTAADNLRFLLENAEDRELSDIESENLKKANKYSVKFDEAMSDDANSADAISAIFELVKFANSTADKKSSISYIKELISQIETLCNVLGIEVKSEDEILDEDIEALIMQRQQARKEKNFARADEIRDMLLEKGIILEDTRQGVKWKRA